MQDRPGLCRCIAIDDGSRFQVLAAYSRKNARSTLDVLERVVEETPFAIQRTQSDRGQEFFACDVQQHRLREWRITFRPIRPRSPHLDGKVERVQRTAREEFWPTVDLPGTDVADRLAEWQTFYNWQRPHDSLGGRAPIDRVRELRSWTPLGEDIAVAHDPSQEFIRINDYGWDSTFSRSRR